MKSLNNTWINIIKLLFSFFFPFEDHRIGKFSNNIDLRKLDFLSEEKISECSSFVNKDVMQSWLLLSKFLIQLLHYLPKIILHMHYLTENRLRYASGPVHSLHRICYIHSSKRISLAIPEPFTYLRDDPLKCYILVCFVCGCVVLFIQLVQTIIFSPNWLVFISHLF